MKIFKRAVAMLLAFSFIMGVGMYFPMNTKAAEKNGCYSFSLEGRVKISKKFLIIKKLPYSMVSYDKKKFKRNKLKDMERDYKFKLEKRIYVYDWEDPVYTVRKFGVKFFVTHSKYMKKSAYVKSLKKNPFFISCDLIVKKGKVVAIGSGA